MIPHRTPFEWFLLLTPLVFIVAIIVITYWPYDPLDIKVQPYRLETATLKPGEPIIYFANVCKNTNLSPTVSRKIIKDDGTVIALASISTSIDKGCGVSRVATTGVPLMTPPGRYYLSLSITYQYNTIAPPIVKKARTDWFTVIAP